MTINIVTMPQVGLPHHIRGTAPKKRDRSNDYHRQSFLTADENRLFHPQESIEFVDRLEWEESTMYDCLESIFLPCFTYGRTQERLNQISRGERGKLDKFNGACFCFFSCLPLGFIPATLQRTRIRATYNIRGSYIEDCMTAFFCLPCSLARDDREICLREKREDSIVNVQPNGQDSMRYVSQEHNLEGLNEAPTRKLQKRREDVSVKSSKRCSKVCFKFGNEMPVRMGSSVVDQSTDNLPLTGGEFAETQLVGVKSFNHMITISESYPEHQSITESQPTMDHTDSESTKIGREAQSLQLTTESESRYERNLDVENLVSKKNSQSESLWLHEKIRDLQSICRQDDEDSTSVGRESQTAENTSSQPTETNAGNIMLTDIENSRATDVITGNNSKDLDDEITTNSGHAEASQIDNSRSSDSIHQAESHVEITNSRNVKDSTEYVGQSTEDLELQSGENEIQLHDNITTESITAHTENVNTPRDIELKPVENSVKSCRDDSPTHRILQPLLKTPERSLVSLSVRRNSQGSSLKDAYRPTQIPRPVGRFNVESKESPARRALERIARQNH